MQKQKKWTSAFKCVRLLEFAFRGGHKMNIKRSWFALFISVFVICGCSGSSVMSVSVQNAKVDLASQMKTAFTTKQQKTVEYQSSEVINAVEYRSAQGGEGISWIASKVQEASAKKTKIILEQEVDRFGNIIKETFQGKEEVEATPTIMQYGGSVSVGSTFQPRLTSYGADCVGCGTGTAAGVKLTTDEVRQSDGSWKSGITYDGYYIVAADATIPMYSILKISNHGYSGKGMDPNEPIYAMVLDRGGGVKGAHLDFFVGSEAESGSVYSGNRSATVEIVRVGA